MLCICASLVLPGWAAAPLPNGGWDAALSPDGTLLAFISGSRHGVPNLWVTDTAGKGKPRQLTIRGAHRPRWIPGTHTIAFGTMRTGSPTDMAIAADGGIDSEQPILTLPHNAEQVSWSPNGALFAYGMTTRNGAARDLCFGRAQGGGTSELTKNFWVREWAWMPDGSGLAVVVGKATGTSLWTVTMQEKDVELLYKGFCGAPAYSPDGKLLAVAIPDIKSGSTIELIDLETRTGRRFTLETFDGKRILWSADGKWLYFQSGRKYEPSVWRIGVDGEGLMRLTPKGTAAYAPDISPDGKWLAYHATTKRSYGPELYLANGDGRHAVRLTITKPSYWSPVWSPDSRQVLYHSDVNHSVHLYLKNYNRFGRKQIAELVGDPAETVWIPGTKRLLVGDSGRLQTIDFSARKLQAVPVPNLKTPALNPRLHGDEIIFAQWLGNVARIAAIKLDGTGLRPITLKPAPEPEKKPEEPKHDTGRIDARRKVAGTQYLFVQYTGSEVAETAPAPTETGDPHSGLGVMGPQPDVNTMKMPALVDTAPAVSPDGKLIAFVRQGQIWLVNRDGTEERQLTAFKPAADEKQLVAVPTWTPQGETLLFFSLRMQAGGIILELWLCGTQEGSERMIYAEKAGTEYGYFYLSCTNPPVFMPGGKRILFTSVAAANPRIVSIALDGSDLEELVPSPATYPMLDATGSKLAYVDLSNTQERLRVRDLVTGKVVKLP
ncbi:MAG: TolB family protein [Armatimonadota bacterium]